ncbi:MAG: hotdog fold thioesterase [Planctomycetes bacterium]|nr:hotdog fold thioesterase [Planctomycetota bacterium]
MTDPELVSLDAIRQFFVQGIPFNRHMGLVVEVLERGRMVIRLPFKPEFVGDPTRPALHGGVLSMLADTVGGGAVFSLTRPGDRLATIDLRVDYLLPGRPEEVVAEAKVIRIGNRVGVSSVELTQGAPAEVIAVAMGVYTIRRNKGAKP